MIYGEKRLSRQVEVIESHILHRQVTCVKCGGEQKPRERWRETFTYEKII